MLNLLNYTRCLSLLLLIAYPMTVNATQPYQTTELTVILKSTRPLPPDLVPVLYYENVYGEIHDLKHGLASISEMKAVSPYAFKAEVRWHQPEIALAIDHPGFLRGFSTVLPLSETSITHTIILPMPGSLYAYPQLESYQDDDLSAIRNFFDTSLTRHAAYTYQIAIPTQPLQSWELNYDDLSPGNYSIYTKASGRFYFPIKSDQLTDLSFPIFTDSDLNKSETTSPSITIKPRNPPSSETN